MKISIYFDGAVSKSRLGCDMGIGIAVKLDDVYVKEFDKELFVKGNESSSSNVAEWLACVEAMKYAAELFDSDHKDVFEIYSDSQIITYQFEGTYNIKNVKFKEYFEKAWYYANQVGIKKINWVNREKNKEADILSKKGIALINSQNVCDTRCV